MLIGIVVLLWVIYFIQTFMATKKDPFARRAPLLHRAYIRQARNFYD
jgi:hypothetical protein